MSANPLTNVGKMHSLADDLESFLHVLGWMMLYFVPAPGTYTPAQHGADLEVFDEHRHIDGFDRGGGGKTLLFLLQQFPSELFISDRPTPLFNLARSLRSPFESLYAPKPSPDTHREIVHVYDLNIERLESSDWFINEIEKALRDPTNN